MVDAQAAVSQWSRGSHRNRRTVRRRTGRNALPFCENTRGAYLGDRTSDHDLASAAETVTLLGTRLGPYEILSAIGAGGMGEVYRATDTNLGRDVAIKVLPEAFAQDPERIARFEREAKTLA